MPPKTSPLNPQNISTTPQLPEAAEMNRTHPQMLPDPKAAGLALGRSVLLPLTTLEEPYLDSSVLPKYRVNVVRSLGFHTGLAGGEKHKYSPPSEQYLEPMSLKDIWKLLGMYKPWKSRADIMVDSRQSSGFHEANSFWVLMHCYLTGSENEDRMGFMVPHTPWQSRDLGNPSKFTALRCEGKHDWALVDVFQHAKHAPGGPLRIGRPVDPDKPHLIAVLADSAPLRKDKMSTSELTASLYLACNTAVSNAHKNHRYFPVTLITVAHRTVRITQCILDTVSQSFEIRQTPLVHFENGVWAKTAKGLTLLDEFVTLLAWVVGTPVGQTMPR